MENYVLKEVIQMNRKGMEQQFKTRVITSTET